jgi:hypothetical protein
MDIGPKTGSPGELEQLAHELSCRDLHVTLAPDSSNEFVLEVINSGLDSMGAAVRGGHVYWRDGAFWWSRLVELERLPDITNAVERITASLQWSGQYSAPAPPGEMPCSS